MVTHKLARGLGWFSLALGATELLAGRRLSAALGVERQAALTRAYGLREIASGVGILAARDPRPGVWSRVAGDLLDLSTLAAALPGNRRRGRAAVALSLVVGVTVFDLLMARRLDSMAEASRKPVRDYGRRSGFPRQPAEMRGLALDAALSARPPWAPQAHPDAF